MEAIVLCGIQASGKTSYAKRNWYDTHVRINLDMLRTRNREHILLHACLAAKASFVVDNTNPMRNIRKKYQRLARAADYDSVVLYYFKTSVDDALRRNSKRPKKQRVPDKAIIGTANKLEVPSLDEGWDHVFVVTITKNNNFHMEEMKG